MNNSLITIAYNLVSESEKGLEINELLEKTLETANVTKTAEVLSNLYIEICTSSKFIYLSDEDGCRWDLKIRHSLEDYDKDGYKFVQTADDEKIDDFTAVEEHEDLESDGEETIDVETEEDEDNDSYESDKDDHYNDSDSYSDEDDDNDYFNDDDEEKYLDTMDQYEDQYDR